MLNIGQHHLLGKVTQRFRALGDENRLRLLILLQSGEKNVASLTEPLDLRQASVSKHLAVLKQAGLVTSRREGTQVFYRVADQSVYQMCELVCDGILKDFRSETQAMGLVGEIE